MRPGVDRGPSNQKPSSTDSLLRMGLLAACVAHDLNNHLMAASAQLELARTRCRPTETASRCFVYAQRELELCPDLIRYLLPARSASTLRDDCVAALHEALTQTLDAFSPHMERKGIRVVLDAAPDGQMVRAPRWVLSHVFRNVIANACDAMSAGGELRVSAVRRRGRCEIAFADTGCGIPEEHLERAFDPSFTTKAARVGHGFGLATCRAVLTHIGGAITLSSGEAGGTVVRVALQEA